MGPDAWPARDLRLRWRRLAPSAPDLPFRLRTMDRVICSTDNGQQRQFALRAQLKTSSGVQLVSSFSLRTPRDVFTLLSHFKAINEFDALLDLVDWSGFTPYDVYGLVLQRLPESGRFCAFGPTYSPREHFKAAVLSAEFQKNIINLASNAFGDRKRLIHIHIPKTAGTALNYHLVNKFPTLQFHHRNEVQTSKDQLLQEMRKFADRARDTMDIYLCGHVELDWCMSRGVYRYGDKVFTIVRHPHRIVLSLLNFYIDQIVSDPASKNANTRKWLAAINLKEYPKLSRQEDFVGMARLLLANQGLIEKDVMCKYLGSGTCESSIDLMARANIEITEVNSYAGWLRQAWNINSNIRVNKSTAYVNFDMFSQSDKDGVVTLCQEDLRLYNRIIKAMSNKGEVYVTGRDLLG